MSWSAPEDWSRWDPDRLLVCPYDESHRIRAKRFQHHLLKCRQNHPDKDFVTCPFNAKHVMLRHEIRHHVSRCPDRSVIEQYNYKGSEKDEDGFYFKGNTSVPSYHRTEELQEPSESWDNHEGQCNPRQTVQNNTERFEYHQTSPHSTAMVTDTLRLSPEERENYRRQLRREAVSRNSNPGMQLPSRMCATSQGYNTNLENVQGQQFSPSLNPIFRHCVQQGAISSLSQQQQGSSFSNFSEKNGVEQGVSKPKNPIFQYCIENMRGEAPQAHSLSPVYEASSEQYVTQVSQGDRNLGTPCVSSTSYTNEIPPSLPTDTNLRFRSSGFVTEMENKPKQAENDKPDVAVVSNVCGQPTSPTSKGVNAPQLAGVGRGRARLHAEARKNNFGGICFSTARTTGNETTKTPTAGRGRGILNIMYSS